MKADGTNKQNNNVPKKINSIKDVLLAKKDLIQTALPNNMSAERFTRLVLLNIHGNRKLGECDPVSVLAAAMQSAQLGLEPGGSLGQAYLIPYGKQCQFQIGFRGMIELCRRSDSIQTIMAYTVFSNDDFEFSYGFDERLYHKPALTNKGDEIAYYAYAILKDGGRAFIVMSKEDILAHAKKFSKTFGSGPWQTDFNAMAKKTCIKQLLKYLPVSVELLKKASTDGAVRDQLDIDMVDLDSEDIIDVDIEVPADNQTVDPVFSV